MKSNFDLRKFLVENKLTPNSKILEAKMNLTYPQMLRPKENGIFPVTIYGGTDSILDTHLEEFTKAAEEEGVDWQVRPIPTYHEENGGYTSQSVVIKGEEKDLPKRLKDLIFKYKKETLEKYHIEYEPDLD